MSRFWHSSLELTKKLIGAGQVVRYQLAFADIAESATGGIFLSQLYYWSNRTQDPDGWIYKTNAEWMEETRLSSREVAIARKVLREKKVLEEQKKGLPCRLYYRINLEQLAMALNGIKAKMAPHEILSLYSHKLYGNAKGTMVAVQQKKQSRRSQKPTNSKG